MNIVVLGLGAIGLVYAVSLKACGYQVYGITKEKYLQYFSKKSLKITGIFGEKEVLLDGIYSDVEDLPDTKVDLIILSVKSFDTKSAVLKIKKIVKEETLVLLAQNGYGNYEVAKDILGDTHVILGRVIFGSKLLETGVAEVTVIADDVVIGQPDLAIDDVRIMKLAELFSICGIPTRFSKDVYPILWDKILYNCALNPLGAILECSYGTLADCFETKMIMNEIIREIFEVTKKAKIKLLWENVDDYLNHFYHNLIPPTKNHFPSMYYDIKSGKKTEIDALNGAIVRLAKENMVSCLTNELITNLIKSKELISKRLI